MNKNNRIDEASLSRVFKHFNDPNTTVVIFTAFRDGVDKETNVRKNKKFAAELRKAGFGYFFVTGHFVENEGTEDEVEVTEDSIFAIADKNKSQKLINLCHELANQANQDSIIVKELDKGIYFLTKDGKKIMLSKGKIKFSDVDKFYTVLRHKNPKTNQFVFEGAYHLKTGFAFSLRKYLEKIKNKELKN